VFVEPSAGPSAVVADPDWCDGFDDSSGTLVGHKVKGLIKKKENTLTKD
jgi:hypothetical protein